MRGKRNPRTAGTVRGLETDLSAGRGSLQLHTTSQKRNIAHPLILRAAMPGDMCSADDPSFTLNGHVDARGRVCWAINTSLGPEPIVMQPDELEDYSILQRAVWMTYGVRIAPMTPEAWSENVHEALVAQRKDVPPAWWRMPRVPADLDEFDDLFGEAVEVEAQVVP
jgi:hypothetical protein